MTHELNATYEQGGVLRLSHPLPLADHQHVQVIVSDNQQPTGSGRWAAIDLRTGEILLYADTVKKARDQGRALDRGEPLIHWVSGDSELPSAGL
jgi:hypothetical protein